MTILVLDFMNGAHRARSGFTAGDYPVVFNYFRCLRAQVEQFKPGRIIVALEGHPASRHDAMPSYKANRVIEENDPKFESNKRFFKQVDVVVNLLSKHFPVSVVRHPTSEADDTIANLVSRMSPVSDPVIVSSDTDFIQLLQKHVYVKLYNPVTKQHVSAPSDYDYLIWKSLRGDKTDNIPGVPGIGDKTAEKYAKNLDELHILLNENSSAASVFQRNHGLIEFTEWSDEERSQMTCSNPTRDWQFVKDSFEEMGFKSITKESTWKKFVSTFDNLFEAR